MRDPLQISMHNVTVLYGERPVLDDVNLDIPPRKTTVIIGASGSGKSILLKVMAGLLPPNRGAVQKDGKSMIQLSEKEEIEFRRRSGFAFQDGALWANRTIAQNVRFPLEVHFPQMSPAEMNRRVETYLHEVGYEDRLDYRPSQISAGEQKMVSFARALITDPEFLFLDTPLVGIDTSSAKSIQNIIKKLHRQKRTIVGGFIDAKLISMIADELIILHKGRIAAHGPFAEVKQSSNPLVQKVLEIVLKQAAAFDEDILTLLDNEEELF
jgi:phospholipid/cholesterol/gamma-HCH transport system ATP-binding protein